jgi:hypothetical protein
MNRRVAAAVATCVNRVADPFQQVKLLRQRHSREARCATLLLTGKALLEKEFKADVGRRESHFLLFLPVVEIVEKPEAPYRVTTPKREPLTADIFQF